MKTELSASTVLARASGPFYGERRAAMADGAIAMGDDARGRSNGVDRNVRLDPTVAA